MPPLIIYTLRPEGALARTVAEFLSTANQVVQLRPLSELPAPAALGWVERNRRKLEAEAKELRQAIGGLELGLALAAGAPHRFPEGPLWASEKQTHERRLKVVAWKLAQLARAAEQA